MAVKKLSYLDQLKKDAGVEGFQLTDDVVIPPLSLGAIEALQEIDLAALAKPRSDDELGSDSMRDMDMVLHVLFGSAYEAAVQVIPITLAPQVIEDVVRHFMGDDAADEMFDVKAPE